MKCFGRGCCGCEDCCNGSWPEEFDVEISLADATSPLGCSTCDSLLSGAFTVQKTDLFGGCTWQYTQPIQFDGNPVCNSHVKLLDCLPPYGLEYVIGRNVNVQVYCVSASEYQVAISYLVWRRRLMNPFAIPCPIYVEAYTSWTWSRIVATSEFNCSTVSAFAVPRETVASNWYPFCDTDDSLRADAILTAVP